MRGRSTYAAPAKLRNWHVLACEMRWCRTLTSNDAIINALPRVRDLPFKFGLFVGSLMVVLAGVMPMATIHLRAFLEMRIAKFEVPKDRFR